MAKKKKFLHKNKNRANKNSKKQEPAKIEDINLNAGFVSIVNEVLPRAIKLDDANVAINNDEKGVCCYDQCVAQIEVTCDKAVFVDGKNCIMTRSELKEKMKQKNELTSEQEQRNKEIDEQINAELKKMGINETTQSNEQIFDKNLRNIVLVLESPHKDEYYEKKPLGPAIGKTGDNINKYILYNLLTYNYINNLFDSGSYKCCPEIKNGKYNFILMNSVQYQCSLGMTLDEGNKKVKNTIFNICIGENSSFATRNITEKFKQNFTERLKKYKPSIIINCCTIEGKDCVQELINDYVIKNNMQCLLLEDVHPASDYFGCGFKKV